MGLVGEDGETFWLVQPPSQNYRNGSGAINAKLRFTLCMVHEAVVEQVKAAAEDQTHTPG